MVRKLVPITCVDVLPYRNAGDGPEVGLIRRVGADRHTIGWALVGGRVIFGESVQEAITRHIMATLGDGIENGPVDTAHPLHVAEYSPDGRVSGRVDPSKHAVALAYVVEVEGTVTPIGEAVGYQWFSASELPSEDSFVYSHGDVVAALVRADARLHGAPG